MHVIRRRGWEIPERLATPEQTFLNRRAFLATTGAAALSLAPGMALAQRVTDLADPTKDLYPAKRNETFTLDRPVTDEKINTSYNNFYEFGSSKNVVKAAQALKLRPWTVKLDGMVEKPQEIGLDDLIRKMPLEERLYRHRCVEAWSMAIPWSGFPLARLVEISAELFAMSAACARAQGLSASKSPEERTSGGNAAHLADMFCRISRRRVEERFDRLFDNDDVPIYRTAQMVMANEMKWLEKEGESKDKLNPFIFADSDGPLLSLLTTYILTTGGTGFPI